MLKKWLWNQYLKMWPGSDRLIIWQRFNPYSKYVTVYDKWIYRRLVWSYIDYTIKIWSDGTHHLWKDICYVVDLLKRDHFRYEKLRKYYERLP